jgi:apolipoprotein N-acyltransferase
MVRYYRTAYHIPFSLIATFSLLLAAAFALTVLVSRALMRRRGAWASLLGFPLAWVAFEAVMARVSPHGTFWNLAYTQMRVQPLIQVASLAGLAGISFLVTLGAAGIAVAVHSRSIRPLLAPAALAVVVAGWGGWRLSRPTGGASVRVGLAAWDRAPVFPLDSADVAALGHGYSVAIDRLGASGAQVVVLPELIGLVPPNDPAGLRDTLASATRRNRITLVAGVFEPGHPRDHDAAWVLGPDGTLVARYDKQHLIPGIEDHYQPGTALTVLSSVSPAWGVEICKDLDFPALTGAYAGRGVGLLLVPAWDKVQDGWLHGRMAVMRGVEFGVAVARAAKEGTLTVSDARGRVVAEATSRAAAVASLVADVPVAAYPTPYARAPAAFEGLCLAGLLALLAAGLRPARLGASPQQPAR